MSDNLTIVDHPLIQHKLTILRDKTTSTAQFRQVIREVAFVLGCEVTQDLKLKEVEIETPIEKMTAPYLEGKKLCFVSILRAGNGLLDGLLDLIPSARVGHVGIYRDHETLEAHRYYFKTPDKLGERLVVLVDPMLATGNTAIDAANELKKAGAKAMKFLCLVAAPEGVEKFSAAHPDVPIITAALDRQLNDVGYIMPGLGDAGDRIYGTKG
ncbi:uracil phosphoribosyltransferase [Hyphococcus luteus]|uniref:Uracil phosphoribosyltransferase n=1 Tax=Hyphococcus luteus TaxID=2058213 RepID=A0A2S7JZ60_9PROT|nr:uracil phosphoribosyltransferase [Marinicaulis flavus]PQA85545.1 uracil phosphoribosyltransferase [Marinicaulis flavus]